VKWGISKSNSLDLGYQWVEFSSDKSSLDNAVEGYLTIGWAHQMTADAGFKVGYQFINYDDGSDKAGPYGVPGNSADYRGGLAVAQFGVSF
jgi:hypothetical protein